MTTTTKSPPGESAPQVGDRVTWRTTPNHEHTGEVVAVVPPNVNPAHVVGKPVHATGLPRNHVSYVVRVGSKLYWPRVAGLRLVVADATAPQVGDVWECDGDRFKLVKFSDGWDGPRGWHCDPGWIGAYCFPPEGNARLVSRAGPAPMCGVEHGPWRFTCYRPMGHAGGHQGPPIAPAPVPAVGTREGLYREALERISKHGPGSPHPLCSESCNNPWCIADRALAAPQQPAPAPERRPAREVAHAHCLEVRGCHDNAGQTAHSSLCTMVTAAIEADRRGGT